MQTGRYESMPMPRKYLAEMVMDRVAACKVYQGSAYTQASALIYLESSIEQALLHPQLFQELHYLLTMMKEKGEKETFAYIKNHVLKGKPFPWEESEEN